MTQTSTHIVSYSTFAPLGILCAARPITGQHFDEILSCLNYLIKHTFISQIKHSCIHCKCPQSIWLRHGNSLFRQSFGLLSLHLFLHHCSQATLGFLPQVTAGTDEGGVLIVISSQQEHLNYIKLIENENLF